MTPRETRIRKLTNAIRVHNKAYYDDGKPFISDAQYDALVAELAELEKADPASEPTKSVTQEVGGSPGQVEHRAFMGSLNKAKDVAGLDEFFDRVRGEHHVVGAPCVATPKLDGVAFSLIYEGGRLVRAATRGNGRMGWDHTANMEHIPSVPKELPEGVNPDLEIRGEMMVSQTNYNLMSGRKDTDGRVKSEKRRNCVAGTALNKKNANPKALAHLDFFAYWALDEDGSANWSTADDTYKGLGEFVQVVKPYRFVTRAEDVLGYMDDLDRDGEFGIEGCVIRLNDCEQHQAMGHYGKGAVASIAYKWK